MSFQLLYRVVVQSSSVGSCWYNPSLSKQWATAWGSITDVRLGGASGGTKVTAAQSWRIGRRYYILLGTDLYRGQMQGITKVEQGLAVLTRAQWRGGQQLDPDKGSQAAI